jgi:uncharacterized protein YqgV (UPF0045/DUF77 family)
MRITAELSLYPLQADALDRILTFIAALTSDARLEIVVNQLSTQVRGEVDAVTAAIAAALRASFAAGGAQALVVKYLNADLPIAEPPVLEPRAG